ncbi:MAG: Kdo hydroxylase family protein [Alphaproteobacteria bacterium]
MTALLDLPIESWPSEPRDGAIDAGTAARAIDALEDGLVVYFPALPFPMSVDEASLLDPGVSDGKAKNVTWFPDQRILKGAKDDAALRARLTALLDRYATTTRRLVETLFPGYRAALAFGPTTLRPVEIAGRPPPSWRRDDTRLHTDAFPARPTGGTRILRVFSNVDPAGTARRWRVGGRFEDFAAPRVQAIRRLLPGESALLAGLGITRGRRGLYDHLMLALHDRMKGDDAYQRDGVTAEVSFPAGTSWMVFTDQVPHAAIAGRNALEQTFHLPVTAQRHPGRAPLRVLERLCGRRLAP